VFLVGFLFSFVLALVLSLMFTLVFTLVLSLVLSLVVAFLHVSIGGTDSWRSGSASDRDVDSARNRDAICNRWDTGLSGNLT
jgi:hypothetical protein